MNISYEEFMEIIPKETKTYVNTVLKYLYHLRTYNSDLYIVVKLDQYIYKYIIGSTFLKEIVMFIEALYGKNNYQYIARELAKGKFVDRNDVEISYKETIIKIEKNDLKETFNTYKNYFQIYNNVEDYYGLTTLDLINNIYKDSTTFDPEIYRDGSFYFHKYFITQDEYNNLNIEKIIKVEKAKIKNDLKKEVFSNIQINVVNLIETASSIYNAYINPENNDKEKLLSLRNCFANCNSKEDIAALSLFMSFLTSKDSNIKEMINKLKIDTSLISKYNDVLSNLTLKPNYLVIKKYYQPYIECLKNIKLDPTKELFATLFNRNATNSTIVETILSSYNLYKDNILDLLDERDEQIKINDFLKEQNITDNDKNVLINLTKAYTLILSKKKDNTKYLKNNNDIISLAYLFTNKSLYNFYEEHDITYDKIFNLLGINITKEELESTKVSFSKIKSVYESTTINQKENKITFNNGNSLVLENIFNDLSKDKKIDDITKELKEFTERKQQEHQNFIYKELYTDLKPSTINYLKCIAEQDTELEKILNNLSPEDKKVAAILYVTLNDKSLQDFLKEKGLTNDSLNNFNKQYFSSVVTNDKDFNEILYNNYLDYIFKGYNSSVERKDLTPYHIFRNIFNKELYDGTYLIRFLHHISKNYEDFNDLDTQYENYFTKQRCESLLRSTNSNLSREYLTNAIKYNTIIEKIPNITDLDKEKLSLILAFFDTYNTIEIDDDKNNNIVFIAKTLEKYNITKERILEYLNITNPNIKSTETSYRLGLNYQKYLEGEKDYSISSIIKKLFSNEVNNSNILKIISNLSDENYSILQKEIITGKEYIPTLSECIKSLQNIEVSSIDLSSTINIVNYGNILTSHFKTINQEQQKLIDSDSTGKSVETINELVNKCYQPEEKKKGFFSSLFSVESGEKESNIKIENFHILKDAISKNIELLSKELLTYDKLKKYISEYSKKNYEFLLKTIDMIKLLENKLQTIDPSNPFEYSNYLDVSSQLQIVKNKKERFITSNQLLNQELVKLNQMIVNHFLTINALETARDDLLPLIGSELLIGQGIENEKRTIELSKDVMDLFKALLYKNADDAKITLDKLNDFYNAKGTINVLNSSVTSYIETLEQSNIKTEEPKKLVKEK